MAHYAEPAPQAPSQSYGTPIHASLIIAAAFEGGWRPKLAHQLMIRCVETASLDGLGLGKFLMFHVSHAPRHLQILVAVTNQGDGPGVVWKWQQVPVATVSLGSLGMALGQVALRRQLPNTP